MVGKNYELIEHTADVGIRVKAGDLKGLFKNSALAMFDIIAQKQETKPARKNTLKINLKADNLEELFIYWLNELLSLSAVKGLIFSGSKINKLDDNNIVAAVTGEDAKNYKINSEIKAATYHQLKLEKIPSGWQAEVIFDV